MSGQRGRPARPDLARAQHFIGNRRVAAQVVTDAGITATDIVVEFGAGSGALTDVLAERARAVLAVEIDGRLVSSLAHRYRERPHVVVIGADALAVPLPASPFRVVANPPFNRTSALLRRLLGDLESGLVRADLIVQWQVARARAVADRGPCDLLGASWGPWWQFRRGRRLPAKLFQPEPAVDAAVLTIERRPIPLLATPNHKAYSSFLQERFRGGLRVIDWVEQFRVLVTA